MIKMKYKISKKLIETLIELDIISELLFKKTFRFKHRTEIEKQMLDKINFSSINNNFQFQAKIDFCIDELTNNVKKYKEEYSLLARLHNHFVVDEYLENLIKYKDYNINSNLPKTIKKIVANIRLYVIELKILIIEKHGDLFDEIKKYNISEHIILHCKLSRSFKKRNFQSCEDICASFLNSEIKNKLEKFKVVSKSDIKHFIGEYLGDIFNSYGEFIECKNLKSHKGFLDRHYCYHFRGQKSSLVMVSNIDDDRTNDYFYFMFIKWSKEKRFFIKNKNLFL